MKGSAKVLDIYKRCPRSLSLAMVLMLAEHCNKYQIACESSEKLVDAINDAMILL